MLAADFWILSHYTSALFFKVVILSIYLCFTDHLSMQVHFIEILRKVQLHLILQKYLQKQLVLQVFTFEVEKDSLD